MDTSGTSLSITSLSLFTSLSPPAAPYQITTMLWLRLKRLGHRLHDGLVAGFQDSWVLFCLAHVIYGQQHVNPLGLKLTD